MRFKLEDAEEDSEDELDENYIYEGYNVSDVCIGDDYFEVDNNADDENPADNDAIVGKVPNTTEDPVTQRETHTKDFYRYTLPVIGRLITLI